MTPADIARIEKHLGVRLPSPYSVALLSHNLPGSAEDFPEFTTEIEVLLSDNEHFLRDPEDLSSLRGSGLLASLKFWFTYGSAEATLKRRREWHRVWAKGNRFVVGSDLGEERYYIELGEANPAVHVYELESGKSRIAAASIAEWLTNLKSRATEGET